MLLVTNKLVGLSSIEYWTDGAGDASDADDVGDDAAPSHNNIICIGRKSTSSVNIMQNLQNVLH